MLMAAPRDCLPRQSSAQVETAARASQRSISSVSAGFSLLHNRMHFPAGYPAQLIVPHLLDVVHVRTHAAKKLLNSALERKPFRCPSSESHSSRRMKQVGSSVHL
jgi:hypothetical protein